MEIYLVGGAVRDKLLNLAVKDRDWVVVGATVEQMLNIGYKQVGKDFPVFLHPETNEEYALARTERKTGKGYTGFNTFTSTDITLEQDLKRRDLTINAIAEDQNGKIIDPFNGQEDLANGLLRHVSAAFCEDPVRILRAARFAARFAPWGFKIAHGTNKLMKAMVAEGEIDALVAERVWAETAKALAEPQPQRFFQVLRGCNALAKIFPEIAALDSQTAASHQQSNECESNITILALNRSVTKTDQDSHQSRLRFAALMLHLADDDECKAIGDIEHFCVRIKVPAEFRDLAVTCRFLMPSFIDCQQLPAPAIVKLLSRLDAFRRADRFNMAVAVCYFDTDGSDAQRQLLLKSLELTANIDTKNFVEKGLKGKQIGDAIFTERCQRVERLLFELNAG